MTANIHLYTAVGGAIEDRALDLSRSRSITTIHLPLMPLLEPFPMSLVAEKLSSPAAVTYAHRAHSTGKFN